MRGGFWRRINVLKGSITNLRWARGRREEVHSLIACSLEQGSGQGRAVAPEIIAHHFTEARQFEPAGTDSLRTTELAMKHLLALVLGFGAMSVASCGSTHTADVASTDSLTMEITGMT